MRNRLCRGRLSLLVKLIDSVAAEDPDRSSISIPRNDHLQRISYSDGLHAGPNADSSHIEGNSLQCEKRALFLCPASASV